MSMKGEAPAFIGFLKRKWWLILLIIAILGALIVAGFFALNYFNSRNQQVQGAQTTNQNQPTAQSVDDLVKEIRQMILLPDEAPEVATISNVDVLKGQDFFKNAKNGDSVLIFKKAGRGLIYRPTEHKIIEYTKVTYSGSLPQ